MLVHLQIFQFYKHLQTVTQTKLLTCVKCCNQNDTVNSRFKVCYNCIDLTSFRMICLAKIHVLFTCYTWSVYIIVHLNDASFCNVINLVLLQSTCA